MSLQTVFYELTNLYNKVQDFSEEYADVKDLLLSEDVMEVANDSFSVLKLFNNSRKAYSMIKFKQFLKGLNYEEVNKETLAQLISYIDNREKAEFVTNSFDRMLMSNSKVACCVMGLMLNEMKKNNKNIDQTDLILINALSAMNDFDVKNFNFLYQSASQKYQTRRTEKKRVKYKITYKEISECAPICGTTIRNINLTMNVLERYGIMEVEANAEFDGDEDDINMSSISLDELCYFNKLSERLYNYTKLLYDENGKQIL